MKIIKYLSAGLGLLAVLLSMAFLIPGPIQRDAYMGSEYCGSCHQEEYKSWSNSAHAKSYVHLPADKKKDRSCLSCHAMGVFEKQDPVLGEVGCESCHGPGQYYALPHAQKDQVLSKYSYMLDPKLSCVQCHTNNPKLGTSVHVHKASKNK